MAPIGAARANLSRVPSFIPDSLVSRPQDDRTFTAATTNGVRITTSQEWPDIGARISANPSGFTTAYVYRVSDGALMGSVDISSLVAGDAFTVGLDNALQPHDGTDATRYNFVIDANGSEYTQGSYQNGVYPYTSSDGNLEIVSGATGAQSTPSGADAINLVEVGNVGFS